MQTLKLPDLDRLEALARGLSDIRDQIMQDRVVSVVDVEDLIDRLTLARRAQPEGEAPQADGLTRYSMWSNPVGHGMDPSPSGDWVSFDEVRDLLAAQSQGAPCRACHGIGTYIGQNDGYDDADCSECDGSGKAKVAAQPAAEHGHETIVREGGDLVCTACGTSAPGTPEAPVDDALLLRTVVEHGMQLHFEGRGEDDAVWVDDQMKWSEGDRLGATRALIVEVAKQRAAQLDGGQGEERSQECRRAT